MGALRILHLVGSAQDQFHCDLSYLYAQGCWEAISSLEQYESHLAYITPDRHWRFPTTIQQNAIKQSTSYSLAEAIEIIRTKEIDLVVPQMFCLPGMTEYRSLFDLLQIPYVGNTATLMAITADKAKAKAIIAANGIRVPSGQLVRCGERPNICPPVIIKPTRSDNSMGVSLVRDLSEYDAALAKAFEYADEVLIEDYIELGREVRCGVIVQQGELVGLPLEEYQVNPIDHPIRMYSDKLKRTEKGDLSCAAKAKDKAWMVDPRDPITAKVHAVAKQCHVALGCRHYSLFDFRIDPQGQPWFLEAGLYCSFSPKSVVACMAKAAGIPVVELLELAIASALNPLSFNAKESCVISSSDKQ
ncbi:MAG: D-alanine--D-alanine ligase [Symploca sp. SIO1B1]|nr:D-alanine--D-alanine ligase [Symploca sp. SIO1C2]NER94969.1 D-alanine--D-alanine ligase [Symploca sp. SIO1B1]